MLKSKIHIFGGGEFWRSTFDAESINTKMTNSHFHRWKRRIKSQLLMLSPEMLKSHIHIFAGEGEGVGGQLLMLSPKILKS